jgi:hypothetical protein
MAAFVQDRLLGLLANGAGGIPAHSVTDILSSVKAPGTVAAGYAVARQHWLALHGGISYCSLTGKAVATC